MASTVTPPRGMRDFLPAEKARREYALGVIRRVYAAHGFDEIETPVLEDVGRLHSGLGGDNEKLAFTVMRRALRRDDLLAAAQADDPLALVDLGLRFDLTVPLARFYATHRAALPPVFRSIQIAPVWRAERPQKGRYRQFVQCDIDIIGEPSALAELELLQATVDTLAELGLDGCTIRINDRRILHALLATWGVSEERRSRALVTIDKLDKVGAEAVAAELAESGIDDPTIAATLESIAGAGWDLLQAESTRPEWLDEGAYRDLLALRAALPEGVLEFDPTLVRGMGYYTGTIFEVAHPDFGYSLGGGGRYDGMIGRFLGTDIPACGFSLGFERIVDLLHLDIEADRASLALVHDRNIDPARLLALKSELVRRGTRVRLERRAKNLRAQLDRLRDEGFDEFALVTTDVADVDALECKTLR